MKQKFLNLEISDLKNGDVKKRVTIDTVSLVILVQKKKKCFSKLFGHNIFDPFYLF